MSHRRAARRLAAFWTLTVTAAVLGVTASAGQATVSAHTTPALARSASASHGYVDPLRAEPLYVPQNQEIDQTIASFRAHDETHDANLIERIASQPEAIWMTGEPSDWPSLQQAIAAAQPQHAEITVVMYDIPGRDCGSYSSGGAASAAAYRARVRRVAGMLGTVHAAVIVEPDALAEQDCWPTGERESNVSLIKWAAEKFASRPYTTVYIDAGNPIWHPATWIDGKLRQVLTPAVHGFSVDTAEFATTDSDLAFGTTLSRMIGNRHFVVDTSRNGRGPLMDGGTIDWCNPSGRGLGYAPTTHTGQPLVDAYLWIKVPGQSDGSCNGGPPSGTWWPQYALGLAARADW